MSNQDEMRRQGIGSKNTCKQEVSSGDKQKKVNGERHWPGT